jgi:hypothetical protein
VLWIDGEKGIAAQVLMALGAFEECQCLLIPETARHLEGLGVNNLGVRRGFHVSGI